MIKDVFQDFCMRYRFYSIIYDLGPTKVLIIYCNKSFETMLHWNKLLNEEFLNLIIIWT